MAVLRCKCLIIGEPTVGKSALTQVFHSDGAHFPKNYQMTVGVEYCVKTVNVADSEDLVELHLVDSAGSHMFTSHVRKYWTHPACVAVVFDVTSTDSFEVCQKWIEKASEMRDNNTLYGVLIGNKIDLTDRIQVKSKRAERLAADYGLKYYETSALNNTDVEAPFQYIAQTFHRVYQDKTHDIANMVM